VWTLLIACGACLPLGDLFFNTPLGPWAANCGPEKFQAQWAGAGALAGPRRRP
jgi:hypothetical protein